MTNGKPWLDVLLVFQEDRFLHRARSGAIWGTVYFQIGDSQFFPEKGWTDLTAAFARGWLGALLRIAEGASEKEQVPFFDGPFAIDVSVPQKGFVELKFIHEGQAVLSKTAEISQLLAHGRSVASDILSICQQKQWSNNDLEDLARIVNQIRR